MAPLKGELGAKRSEGLSPKGLTSCVKRIPEGLDHLKANHPAAFLYTLAGWLFLIVRNASKAR